MLDAEKPVSLKRALFLVEAILVLVLAITVHFTISDSGIKAFPGVGVEDCLMKQGYGLYVDGNFIAACDSEDEVNKALLYLTDTVAEAYGTPDGIHTLSNSVSVVKGDYGKNVYVNGAGLSSLLGCTENGYDFNVRTVKGTVTDICFGVSTVVTVQKEELVEAPVVSVGTDLLNVGETLTLKQGVDGVNVNEYSVTYVNGMETSSVLVNSTVVTAPTAGEEWYGTTSGATLMSVGDKLMIPSGGLVTSWYGGRILWGSAESHSGLDFAGEGARYGDPIFAAEDGIVSFADFHSGWGKKITIDHTKELSTVYAHCSKMVVEVGDVVRKGQIIGYIGNTGRVTGAHLHFEVMKNGSTVNPRLYLDWTGYQGVLPN